jgi:hypothetical protein
MERRRILEFGRGGRSSCVDVDAHNAIDRKTLYDLVVII